MSRVEFSIADYLLHEMQEVFVIEDESQWAGAQAKRVAERLNRCRGACQPLEPVVFWSEHVTAFTLPGSYVFISRELQQRLPHDGAVAFVLAHEMAHHDLRHFGDIDEKQPKNGARAVMMGAWRALGSLARRPEDEAAADRYALQLCLQAGYRRDDCLEVFRILIAHSLDWGDVDGVFGAFDASDPEAKTSRPWRLRRWWWQRRRGYHCLVERRDRLAQQAGINATMSDRASDARADGSPYRPIAVDIVKHCVRCGREEVVGEESLCAVCQRREKSKHYADRTIEQLRRKELLDDWKWLPVALAVLALVLLFEHFIGCG